MGYESLTDWFRSLGYFIDETQEQNMLDALSRLTQWFSVHEKRWLDMDESISSLKTLFSDEFNSVFNVGESHSFHAGFSGMKEFLQNPVFTGVLDEKSVFSSINGENELRDTFMQLAALSMSLPGKTGWIRKGGEQEKENRFKSDSPEKAADIGELLLKPDEDSFLAQMNTLAGFMDAAPMLHLKMPLQDFLEMKGDKPDIAEDFSGDAGIPVSRTGNDAGIAVEQVRDESLPGLTGGRVTKQDMSSAYLSVLQAPVLADLTDTGNTNISLSAADSAVLQTEKADISEKDVPFRDLFQMEIDRGYLSEKFFGKDVRLDGLQEKLFFFRQTLHSGPGPDVQILMDGLTVRQADSTVLVAYENVLKGETGNTPDKADADSTNRTINITVNGTTSSQETVDAVSVGLQEVDMGMSLRHFKSPMMA